MFNVAEVAVAAAGGHFLREVVEQVPVPKLTQNDGPTACKLSVRVLAASIPGLEAPGLFSRQRPYLEISLGAAQKETEAADFDPSASSGQPENSQECPWRFDEVLTFAVKLEDLSGPGLKLRLRTTSESQLGPLHFSGKPSDIGEATVDLQRRVLPACVQEQRKSDRQLRWTSPLMPAPLMHVRGGLLGAECKLGEAVAHVTLLFSLDADPEPILAAIQTSKQKIEQKLRDGADEMTRWLDQMPQLPAAPVAPTFCCKPTMGYDIDPLDVDAVVGRAAVRAWTVAEVKQPLPGPDASPDKWVSTIGPNGRKYWHNLALGPAPWDELEALHDASPQTPSLPCPDEAPAGWICHEGADGRKFWHHSDLGPAPWKDGAQVSSASGSALRTAPDSKDGDLLCISL